VYAATPFLPLAGPLLLPALLLHTGAEKSLSSTCFTAVFLIINASCEPAARGRVNGLGMSASSGFKAAGPTLGAVCFAWSLTNGLGAPFDVHFTFLVCAGFCALTALVSWRSFSPSRSRPPTRTSSVTTTAASEATPARSAPAAEAESKV